MDHEIRQAFDQASNSGLATRFDINGNEAVNEFEQLRRRRFNAIRYDTALMRFA